MRAAALLERIPFPTDIVQIELSRTPLDESAPSGNEPWRLGVIVRLETTADISS